MAVFNNYMIAAEIFQNEERKKPSHHSKNTAPLIAWYDFTDMETMWTWDERNRREIPMSESIGLEMPIVSISNKADRTNAYGKLLRQDVEAKRPVFNKITGNTLFINDGVRENYLELTTAINKNSAFGADFDTRHLTIIIVAQLSKEYRNYTDPQSLFILKGSNRTAITLNALAPVKGGADARFAYKLTDGANASNNLEVNTVEGSAETTRLHVHTLSLKGETGNQSMVFGGSDEVRQRPTTPRPNSKRVNMQFAHGTDTLMRVGAGDLPRGLFGHIREILIYNGSHSNDVEIAFNAIQKHQKNEIKYR